MKDHQAKVLNVVGARPNLMKIAPVVAEMRCHAELSTRLVHTGQHYDTNMSGVFFRDLGIPEPDVHLEVGSGTHAEQTARIMVGFERVLLAERPAIVLVVGDVNSTLACALVAAKLTIPVAHVEAGLRSWDRSMPEEINRVVTDAISQFHFTTTREAADNLRREGVPERSIHFVGNVMIDTLLRNRERAASLDMPQRLGVAKSSYAVLTLHRPSNVDDPTRLAEILNGIETISSRCPVVFPAHPRALSRIRSYSLEERLQSMRNVRVCEPLGYLEFLGLMASARFVLTDSGGIQEETTVLQVPCITLRDNTERPETTQLGTNVLVGSDPRRMVEAVERILSGGVQWGKMPELWDGNAAGRIVSVLMRDLRL